MKTESSCTDPSKQDSLGGEIKQSLEIKYRKNGQMKLLSWNIQDGMSSVEGAKTEDDGFSSILRDSTIFCLQETKTNINIPDYKCENKLRKGSR